MVPTSWRVREGGGAVALMPRCYAARTGLVLLVGRLPVGMGGLSDTAALGKLWIVSSLLGIAGTWVPKAGHVSFAGPRVDTRCHTRTRALSMQPVPPRGSADRASRERCLAVLSIQGGVVTRQSG